MDCRRSLLFLLCAGTLLGCNRQSTVQPTATPPMIGEAPVEKEKDHVARRAPKPSTCVAFGDFRMHAAQEPTRTEAEKQKFYDDARKAYQQALTLDEKNLPALRGLAQMYATVGDHERAVATYKKALQHYPKDASLWMDLGMCHSRAKEWKPGLEAISKAVALDPENRQYGHVLGYAQARAGAFDQALATFTRLDGEAKAHYNVGRMLLHLQQPAAARIELERATALDPKLAPAQELLTQLSRPAAPAGQGVVPVNYEAPDQTR